MLQNHDIFTRHFVVTFDGSDPFYTPNTKSIGVIIKFRFGM
jgi:hypothetical protein